MDLRPYQLEAVRRIRAEWAKGNRRTLLVLPTGTGKTIVFSAVTKEIVREGGRVLILAHREELLNQAADKLMKSTGLGCALEKAESTCLGEWFRVVVGSVQTLMNEKRLAAFPKDYFSLIIIDEAHRSLGASYQRILDYFDAKVLGVTATPDRGDMRDLGEIYHSLAFEYPLPQAIKDGYLCPIRALTIPLKLDLTRVGTRGGDFRAEDVGNALEPYLHQIAAEMVQHCQNRRTVVFLPLIATSQKFAAILAGYGLRVAEVNGESPNRREVLDDFNAGKYDVLCNSMLLTEGWDCPPVDCIVNLRATKVRSLFCQIIGRGTRIHPGKDYLLVLDFLWQTARIDLCRPAHLLGVTKEVADAMTARLEKAGGAVDLQEVEAQAEGDVQQTREEALAKKLAEQRNKKRALVDPLQYEMSIHSLDLANYVPAFGWESEPVKPDQRAALEKAGIFADEITCAGKAEKLLEAVNTRRDRGLSTAKQIRCLEKYGFRNVGTWEFATAKKLVDRIAANNWRVPPGVTPSEYRPAQQPRLNGAA
jgi:superfamily II DNA or RNA helicase